MSKVKRIVKGGLINFKRNGMVSFSAVLIVTITLSVILSIFLFRVVLHESLDQVKNKVDVTVYFNVGASEDNILALKSSLEKLPEVASISYTSSADALKLFRDRHASDYPTIQALDEINENPLGAYLNIRAKEVSQYEGITNFLKSDNALVLGSASIIDKINYLDRKVVIDSLESIITGARKLGLLITLLLIIISVIITFNTISLTIFISKEEIGVMRLVGASKMRVRGPFIVEGAVYGVIASFVTLLIFWPVTFWMGRNMTNFLGMNMYEYFVSNIFQILAIILLSGIGIGMLSSLLAVRRYLNK